ncbi:MAG TPA: TonB-dependent vitamin B12 receptor [Thiotrichales bacterium]|nr:TonB-dependent vitamin B12 receptor [Thiotrichales bacterium]
MQKKPLSLLAAVTGLLSLPAQAENLEPIVITATRTAQTADETLAPVTVITREDMERRQDRDLAETLRQVPGLSIANNGGPGKTTSVFLRGTESDHVLVLIDGIKAGSATTGTFAFQDIPVDEIERIEVVRGPRSSLYGSEAIGGVIQIFTRKGGGPLRGHFSAGGGTYSTYQGSAGISGGSERGWFSLSASGFDTKGFNACREEAATAFAGCYTAEPDKDGYRNLSISARGGYRFGNGLEFELRALRAGGENQYDGSYVNESESVQQTLGAGLRYAPMSAWTLNLSAGRSWDKSDNFKDGAFKSRFDTERDYLVFQNDITLGSSGLLTLGLDYQNDQVDSTEAYAVTSRDNKGLFAQYQGQVARHDLQLSLRLDDNEQFGKHTTGGMVVGHDFGNRMRLTASYGTAFKAPTFNELYYPGFGTPTLEPETSRSFELGVRGLADWGHWSVNAYHTRIDNLIAYDSSWQPANIDEARILGLEAVVGAQVGGWQWNTTLGLMEPKNTGGGANDGNELPRRARESLRIDADRSFGRYSLGGTLEGVGRRYDDLANTRPLAGYGLVHLRGEYRLDKGWRLQGKVENLFDKDYETAAYYNQPGRSFYLTLRWNSRY